MIQFNLLPDVKMKYVKAKRTKRLIISSSLLVSAVSFGVVILLFGVVQFAQKKHINDLTSDIKKQASDIQSIDKLGDILTVQNQLSLLTGLHEKKPETSRLFDYITFVSPANMNVLTLNFNYESSTIILQGSADNISTVNKLVDNIKATTYTADDSEDEASAFSKISTQLTGDNEKASFKVQMSYEPTIFDNTKAIKLYLNDQSYSTEFGGQQ